MFYTIVRNTAAVIIAAKSYSFDPEIVDPPVMGPGEVICTDTEYQAARAALMSA